MSTEKLSELSKPVAWDFPGSKEESRQLGYDFELDDEQKVNCSALYSQEYISALLAELEAKDERIKWLESISTDYIGKFQKVQDALKYAAIMSDEDKKKIAELEEQKTKWVGWSNELGAKLDVAEKRLATPVRLPDVRQSSSGDRYQWSDGAHNYRLDVISMLLGAGFTVAVEGDSE